MITPQFLQSCQSGDESAIESLVRAHQRPVFQIALSVLDDTQAAGQIDPAVLREAETATRETFIAALDRLGRYREDTPFEPWLYGIAVKMSRRRYRRWKMRAALERLWKRVAPAGRPNPYEEKPAPHEARLQPGDAELWAAVRVLPEPMRLAVVLRYYHDLSIADIARVLRVSEGAIHARLDGARERIAKGA